MRTGHITLAELDTFVAGDFFGHAHVGGSVVLQQPNESVAMLMVRVRHSAQVLRESGCSIASTTFLLGAHATDRLTERLDLARSLLGLLTDASATLHLVSTAEASEQERLFELVGWLLAEGHHDKRIRLTFRQHAQVACRAESPSEHVAGDPAWPALDLTA